MTTRMPVPDSGFWPVNQSVPGQRIGELVRVDENRVGHALELGQIDPEHRHEVVGVGRRRRQRRYAGNLRPESRYRHAAAAERVVDTGTERAAQDATARQDLAFVGFLDAQSGLPGRLQRQATDLGLDDLRRDDAIR